MYVGRCTSIYYISFKYKWYIFSSCHIIVEKNFKLTNDSLSTTKKIFGLEKNLIRTCLKSRFLTNCLKVYFL